MLSFTFMGSRNSSSRAFLCCFSGSQHTSSKMWIVLWKFGTFPAISANENVKKLSSVPAIHIWAGRALRNSRRRSACNRPHQLPEDRGCKTQDAAPESWDAWKERFRKFEACIFLDVEECKFLSLRYLVSLIDNNLWCSDCLPSAANFHEPDSFPSSFLPLSSFSGLVEMLPPGLEVLKVSHQIKYSLLFSCEFFFLVGIGSCHSSAQT